MGFSGQFAVFGIICICYYYNHYNNSDGNYY